MSGPRDMASWTDDPRSDGLLAQAAMQAAPDGLLLVDRAGRILMVNAAMEAISGYSAAQLLGQSVSIFLPAHLRERHGEHLFPPSVPAAHGHGA